jgi:hypothetical protein
VRFGEITLAEIGTSSKLFGLNRAKFVRRAVDTHIAQLKNPTVDLYRMATTSKFNQIVLDVLIKHFRPETYDKILEHLAPAHGSISCAFVTLNYRVLIARLRSSRRSIPRLLPSIGSRQLPAREPG